jgi:hypothetical protein
MGLLFLIFLSVVNILALWNLSYVFSAINRTSNFLRLQWSTSVLVSNELEKKYICMNNHRRVYFWIHIDDQHVPFLIEEHQETGNKFTFIRNQYLTLGYGKTILTNSPQKVCRQFYSKFIKS